MNYNVLLIEILTSILGVLLLVMGLLIPRDKKNAVGFVSVLGLAAIFAFSFINTGSGASSFLNGIYISDGLSIYFKRLFIAAAIMVTLMSMSYVKRLSDSRNEFFAICIFALTGMMVLVSSNDFITLYIGLELMTIAFIILTAFDKANLKSTEAGVKYVILSSMSSAVLLYGMSLMYGMSGSLSYPDIFNYLKTGYSEPVVIMAGIMIIAGFAFKITAAPFHMWSPDIYEGAPTPVTAFLAVGSKSAGFAVLIRLFIEVLHPAFGVFSILIITLAILSMIVGNVIAIPQTNIKRMLAFSSISHAGYILIGIVSGTKAGIGAILYYLALYTFANVGAFASVTALSNETGKEETDDFKGMWKRSPFLTATLMLCLLTMAGIPPTAEFIGKLYLFSEVVRQGYLWLAFAAMGMSVVSIYYYIMVIRTLLMEGEADAAPVKIPASLKVVMVVSIAVVLFMGIYPAAMTGWTSAIATAFVR
jgi:NADH-quinone oxidoreductase subunit N